MTALTFLGVFVGYGQMEAGFPAFARQVSEVSTGVIGFAFAVNTAVIVGLQFFVLRRIAGTAPHPGAPRHGRPVGRRPGCCSA